MTEASQACEQDDWAAQRTGWLLWRVPVVVIVVAVALGSPWQAILMDTTRTGLVSYARE